jgi:N-acyl-D-aspartate/D-glutamate deacylase
VGHELVIRGGTVVDGTGAQARTADVAIDEGLIREVGQVDERGAREIDADGLLVTPGWVDVHTHYDGQATWDDVLAPSAWHGVTSVVMGNCGVGFAPAAPDRHEWLIGLMEGVEDIPGTALAEGIQWEWDTFPEYLDALDRRRWTVDVGTQVPHGAVRAYVMGERGARNEPATTEDIAAMRAVVRDAIAAGALGFSTSRTLAHRAIDGEPVPGTFAAEDELFGIGGALRELGRGVFELAPMGSAGEDVIAPVKEVDWMCRLSAAIGRPVTFALLQVDGAPDLWRDLLDRSLDAVATGAQVIPQVAGRMTGLLSGLQTTYSLLDVIPAFMEVKARSTSHDALVDALRDPAVRERILSFEPDAPTRVRLDDAYSKTYVLGSPPDYEPGPEATVAAIAVRRGRPALEVAYDAMLEDGGRTMLLVPILNYSDGSLEPIREMLLHPQAALGLADGGAHVGVICDASMPTFMLTHWVRDRTRGGRLPLEWVVKKQTADTARLYGLRDRGTLAPGMLGDVNLVDLEALGLDTPFVAADLPAGGKRLLQRATGYIETIKRGVTTFADGEDTGARPGRLIRGCRARAAARPSERQLAGRRWVWGAAPRRR